jgi:hypothetical protein
VSDLKVDYWALEDSVSTLSSLKSEFDDIEDRRDDTSGAWGHDAVKDAMHEFASNMDYNRGKLSDEIKTVGEKMSGTIDAFREADAKLAESFDKERQS